MTATIQLCLVAVLVATLGCRDELGSLLERSGRGSIREISAAEAVALLAREDLTVIHPLPRHPAVPYLENAVWLAPEDPIPAAWLDRGRPLLVVGEPDAAVALAARLSRAGAGSLAIVTGELAPLAELRTARRPEPGT